MSGPRLPSVEQLNVMRGQDHHHSQAPPPPPIHPMPHPIDRMSGGLPIGMPPSIRSMSSITSPTICSPSPFHATPQGPPSREPIKISDISNERITEKDAREQLSSFIVMRLEKIDNSHDVDEFGLPLRSAWEKVRQIVETGITKQEAAREIHALERETKSVSEKKAALSSVIQRQLEVAGQMLQEKELDSRYHYVLVQFRSHLKKLDNDRLIYMSKQEKDKKHAKHAKKGKSKPKFERVSITAYFKRTPKLGQSAKKILEEDARNQQTSQLQLMSPVAPLVQSPLQVPVPILNPLSPTTLAGKWSGSVPTHPATPVRPPGNEMPEQRVDDERSKETTQNKGGDGRPLSVHGVQIIQSNERERAAPGAPKDSNGNVPIQERPRAPVVLAGKTPSQGYNGSPRNSASSLSSGSTLSSKGSWSSDQSDTRTAESSVGSGSDSSKISRGRSLKRPQHEEHAELDRVSIPRRNSRERSYDEPRLYPPTEPTPSVRWVPANPSVSKFDLGRRNLGPGRSELETPRPYAIRVQSGVRRVSPPEAKQEILDDGVEQVGDHLGRFRFEDAPRRVRNVRFEDDAEFERLEEDIQQRRALRARLQGTRQIGDFSPSEYKSRWSEHEAREYMMNRQR